MHLVNSFLFLGLVHAWLDLSTLPPPAIVIANPSPTMEAKAVLNGIAVPSSEAVRSVYAAKGKGIDGNGDIHLIVTGKWWDKLYLVSFPRDFDSSPTAQDVERKEMLRSNSQLR